MKQRIQKTERFRALGFESNLGFSLMEAVVGVAIFAVLISGLIGAYSALTKSVKASREKIVLSSLAANYLELVRNLPYSDVGTVNGNPAGTLADASNPINNIIEAVSYDIYYEVTYIDDPADGTILLGTDAAPNDYKQVKMSIEQLATGVTTHFLTNVSPKGLEGLSNAGAILFDVFDASGQPVAGANIHIENTSLDPDIILDRQTDSNGQWVEVALPASVNGYTILVTKTGYSSDYTSPISVGNPNPTKPHSTVVDGQVTQISFSIDVVADLTIRTVDEFCQAFSGVDINIHGGKLIGTSPDVYKYNQDHTSSGGQVFLNDVEWDTYIPVLQSGVPYTIYGTSPIQQISVLPGSNQLFTFVLGAQTANSLRVIVKDSATGSALEGATVRLRKVDATYDESRFTGGSVWSQSDWSGGSGQDSFTQSDRYFADDGNINTTVSPIAVRLAESGGVYQASGVLESSTFDTGAASDFTVLIWEPSSQFVGTSLGFQIATNNDSLTWNYIGPDGTSGTYYTIPGTSFHSSHDGDRYIRYKAYLATTDTSVTSVLSNVSLNYVSGCSTPGQAIFPELNADNDYILEVSLGGYTTQTVDPLIISGNQASEILLAP